MNRYPPNNFPTVFLIALIPFLLFACGGGGGGYSDPPSSSSQSSSSESSSSSSVAPQATLAYLQATIFTPICSQCHIGAGPVGSGGLSLSSEQISYDNLVNQLAQGDPTLTLYRVEPGNPDDSYLVRKLEGGPDIVGDRMPQGLPPLSSSQIALIREWIANGAPREGEGGTEMEEENEENMDIYGNGYSF